MDDGFDVVDSSARETSCTALEENVRSELPGIPCPDMKLSTHSAAVANNGGEGVSPRQDIDAPDRQGGAVAERHLAAAGVENMSWPQASPYGMKSSSDDRSQPEFKTGYSSRSPATAGFSPALALPAAEEGERLESSTSLILEQTSEPANIAMGDVPPSLHDRPNPIGYPSSPAAGATAEVADNKIRGGTLAGEASPDSRSDGHHGQNAPASRPQQQEAGVIEPEGGRVYGLMHHPPPAPDGRYDQQTLYLHHQHLHEQQHQQHGLVTAHDLHHPSYHPNTPSPPGAIPTSSPAAKLTAGAEPSPPAPSIASARLCASATASDGAAADALRSTQDSGGNSGSRVSGSALGGIALGTAAVVVAAAAVRGGGARMDGEAVQNAYNDIGLVVTRAKELEKVMRDLFGATGNGLNELLSSLRAKRWIDLRTQQRIRSIAAMRNKLVHSVDANNLAISNTFGTAARKAFKVMCDDLEESLRECASKPIEEPFAQPARPADNFRLGSHPAFRGIDAGGRDEDYDEAGGLAKAEAAAVVRREQEALVIKDTARFPHNLITAKRQPRRHQAGFQALPAPDVNDERVFPDISFASSAAAVRQRAQRGTAGNGGGVRVANGGGGGGGGGKGWDAHVHGGEGEDEGGWEGQGQIEEVQIISGRGVRRKLGMGEVGYVATTHTMSGVYRKWDCQYRNPADTAWKTKTKEMPVDPGRRAVPGASKGQAAFQARGLDLNVNKTAGRTKPGARRNAAAAGDGVRLQDETTEDAWEFASKARKKRGQKDTGITHSYVVRKPAAAPFWLHPEVQFGRSNCRGWFPTRQDWSASGIPECIYVPLEPSTEDRVEAMRSGHVCALGLTMEEDEERLMRIAIRESAAESKRAYEKKYGTEAARQARLEAQAHARLKALEERESLRREEEQQLIEAIKASLVESLGAGEKDDRDVIAAIEASKRESTANGGDGVDEADDPEVLKVIAESRRQHEAMQELLRAHGVQVPHAPDAAAGVAEPTGMWSSEMSELSAAVAPPPPPLAQFVPPPPTLSQQHQAHEKPPELLSTPVAATITVKERFPTATPATPAPTTSPAGTCPGPLAQWTHVAPAALEEQARHQQQGYQQGYQQVYHCQKVSGGADELVNCVDAAAPPPPPPPPLPPLPPSLPPPPPEFEPHTSAACLVETYPGIGPQTVTTASTNATAGPEVTVPPGLGLDPINGNTGSGMGTGKESEARSMLHHQHEQGQNLQQSQHELCQHKFQRQQFQHQQLPHQQFQHQQLQHQQLWQQRFHQHQQQQQQQQQATGMMTTRPQINSAGGLAKMHAVADGPPLWQGCAADAATASATLSAMPPHTLESRRAGSALSCDKHENAPQQQQQQQQQTSDRQHEVGAPQLAGWAIRSPRLGGGTYSTRGPAVATMPSFRRGEKPTPAWGTTGLASEGLTNEDRALNEALEESRRAEAEAALEEERQLAVVLEASRLAEETRQQELEDARVAIELALRMSVMQMPSAAASPYSIGHLSSGKNNFDHSNDHGGIHNNSNGFSPGASYGAKNDGRGTASREALDSTTEGAATWKVQQLHTAAPTQGYHAPVQPAQSAGLAGSTASSDSTSPRYGEGGGWPGAYLTAGGAAAPPPLPLPLQQQPQRPVAESNSSGSDGGGDEDDDEDEAARELPLALEEEIKHNSSAAAAEVGTSAAVGGGAAPTSGKSGGLQLPPPAVAAGSAGAGDAPALIGSQEPQQQQQEEQDDELSWVLEQSRLEAALQQSRQTETEEGQEAVMARVLEESRREQEKRDA